ncbi:AAA family ATPase [Nakamurella sp.]|uniref:AAA family ATPase n=1 Tax=Nakamurella sp. TaxID=1869182 RepID=UPI003B3A5933
MTNHDHPVHLRVLAAAVRANVPVLAWGEPGAGKSATMHQLGAAWGRHVETVVGSIRDAADISGLPIEIDGVVRNAPVDWAVRCAEADRALLFLDELTTCPPTVMNALLRVCQERVVGDLQLPDSVAIVAAANPPSMAVNGQELSAPIANRFLHLDWISDHQSWWDGMFTDFAATTQPAMTDLIGRHHDDGALRARSEVVAFTRAHRSLIHQMPVTVVDAGKPWPSMRSWHNAARVLGELPRDDVDAADLAVAGCVGQGAATQFIGWRETASLYDPVAVLDDPGIVDWRHRPDVLYALLGSISVMCRADGSHPARWDDAVAVMVAAGRADRADLAAATIRTLLAGRPKGHQIPDAARRVFSDLFTASGRWSSNAA